MKSVCVLDYGVGNILALKSALSKVFQEVHTINTIDELRNIGSRHLVLPGVGAADYAMQNIDVQEFLRIFNENAKLKVLGICLGMQILAEFSEEGNGVKTLGLIKGTTRLLDSKIVGAVPRIGWYRVRKIAPQFDARNSLLQGVASDSFFYFAHSFSLTQSDNMFVDSITDHKIISSVSVNRIFGVQFHPEKSGDLGLKVLENFSK